MIVPIVLYGCELCGSDNYIETEELHLKCLMHILVVHVRTNNNMVYWELDRFSLKIQIKKGLLLIDRN